jgi:hypothetical protein
VAVTKNSSPLLEQNAHWQSNKEFSVICNLNEGRNRNDIDQNSNKNNEVTEENSSSIDFHTELENDDGNSYFHEVQFNTI